MSKAVWWAGAAAVLSVGACATPTPKYAVVADPLAAQATLTAEAAPAAPEPVPVEAPVVQAEVETPRAAPLGRVDSAPLPVLSGDAASAQPAPVQPNAAPATRAAAAPSVSALTHVVGEGDTFFAIGRRYGVGPLAVAEANGLTFADTLRLGQTVRLPAGAVDRGPEAARATGIRRPDAATAPVEAAPRRATLVGMDPAQAAPPSSPIATQPAPARPVAQPAPVAALVTPPVQRPVDVEPAPVAPPPLTPRPVVPTQPARAPQVVAPAPVLPPVAAAVPAPPAVQFTWPLQGAILTRFGPTGVGQRSDGVTIATAEGTPVRASAAGTVVYAGDQVKGGFGKLVLVEHPGRWFTAYAHLSDIGVRMKDRVSQNQQLGLSGRTGNVVAPQLYFEVRHAPTPADRARPVDPLPLLPQ
jgi:murein DD-endopeptidase MepM/ murein hydrolase activator NlpD